VEQIVERSRLGQELARACVLLEQEIEASAGGIRPTLDARAVDFEVLLEGCQICRILITCHFRLRDCPQASERSCRQSFFNVAFSVRRARPRRDSTASTDTPITSPISRWLMPS